MLATPSQDSGSRYGVIGDLRLSPRLNLALQRFEVPLNPVHADRECINQVEALGVLGQDRREHASDNVGKSLACC